MDHRLDLAEASERLTAHALTLASADGESGDVHDLNLGHHAMRDVLGIGDRVDTGVGHIRDRPVGFAGREGVGGNFRLAAGDEVEEACLAAIGEPYEAELHVISSR